MSGSSDNGNCDSVPSDKKMKLPYTITLVDPTTTKQLKNDFLGE